MAEGNSSGSGQQRGRINTPGGIFVRDLQPGTKLRIKGGAIVELIMNANDGGWVFARYLESPDDADLLDTEDWIFFGDVIEEVS
jgi:hypothetical protein